MSAPQGALVVIAGPTASGKTRIAAAVAKALGCEVVNADARQFYHALRIGAAPPTDAEQLGVPHHFIGHLEVTEVMSAGAYERAAVPVIEEVIRRTGNAVLTGGSGLYIDAVLHGFDPLPTADHAIRRELQERFKREGLAPLLTELKERDPATWQGIDRHNPHRVVRALEICRTGGRSASIQRSGTKARRGWQAITIALDVPREELYALIDARVDRMIAAGLVEEARELLPHRDQNALRTVGYRELFEHFDGRCTLDQAIARIKQHTRNYAKRQMTWLRRDTGWKWVRPDADQVLRAIRGFPMASPDRAIG